MIQKHVHTSNPLNLIDIIPSINSSIPCYSFGKKGLSFYLVWVKTVSPNYTLHKYSGKSANSLSSSIYDSNF